MGIPAHELDSNTLEIIRMVQPSGFILYARNIRTPQQLRELTDSLRRSVSHEPIITIDQEGGRVSRLKEFMAEPPSARQLALRNDQSLIEQHGSLIGKLLRLFGFNLNLAPVLDIGRHEESDNSLRDRTYGNTAQQVQENAVAFMRGMRNERILSCGKHFPGYTCASIDPHNSLPIVNRTIDEMLSDEWVPFIGTLDQLDTIMIGHISCPLIDPSRLPATLAPNLVQELVRKRLQFNRCLISDDLDMGAITSMYDTSTAAEMALKAGNDLLLVCHHVHNVPKIAEALAGLEIELQSEAFARIELLRQQLIPPDDFSMGEFEALDVLVKRLRQATLSNI